MSSIFYGGSLRAAGSSDKIEFNDADVVTAAARVMRSSVNISVNDTRVKNPSENIVSTFQTTGPASIDYTITGTVLHPQDTVQVLTNLKTFGVRPGVTDGLPNGAFGVVLDKFHGVFDVTPTRERGLVVLDVELGRDAERPTVLGFVVKMGFIGSRGSSPYNWG